MPLRERAKCLDSDVVMVGALLVWAVFARNDDHGGLLGHVCWVMWAVVWF